MVEAVTIGRLGRQGDGIAATPKGELAVAGALPGETVTVEREGARGRLVSVDAPSPERETPFCPYFPACGGCTAQHMAPPLYRAWKRGLVVEALRRAGIEAEVSDLVAAGGDGRRRVTLHARSMPSERRIEVGYMAARSHRIVDIARCPIAEPGLAEAAPKVARVLAAALARSGKPLDVGVAATGAGLDVDLRGHGPAGAGERRTLARLAADLDLARLSVHGDVVVERRAPALQVGRATVVPPPGAFLQATRLGEETLARLVVEACERRWRVADLFCGCGPFTLRLAERAQVHAVDADAAAVSALGRAARSCPGLRPVTTEARDLFRRPLLPPELERFDAVVLDPPRAGAQAQVRQLAASAVPVVVSVSCDPGTFARDARALAAAGYRLERVVPVDQFEHAAHVEIVGVLRRDAPGKGRRRSTA